MDALKKAQQLRMKEFEGSSFFNRPDLKGEKRRKVKGYFLIFAVTGLGAFVLFFFLWSNILHFYSSREKREDISIEKKGAPVSVVTKKNFQEPHKEDVQPSQREKLLSLMGQFTVEKEKKPITEQGGDNREIVQVKKPEKKKFGRKSIDLLPDSQKQVTIPAKANELEQNPITYFNLGVDLYRHREIPESIQAYQKVIELDPTYVEAYNNLGIIYQDIGDFDKALKAYQKAIEVNPKYEKAYNNLGILLFLNNHNEESIQAFQKAIEINAGNIESYINLGILFKKQGEFNKAIECFQKALAINPLNGEAHYNIGMLYEQLGDYNLAIGHYQRFIQLSSKTYPDLILKVQRHVEYLIEIKGGNRG